VSRGARRSQGTTILGVMVKLVSTEVRPPVGKNRDIGEEGRITAEGVAPAGHIQKGRKKKKEDCERGEDGVRPAKEGAPGANEQRRQERGIMGC